MSEIFGFEPQLKAFTTSAAPFRNRAKEQTIAVDVGASSTKAEISRGGYPIQEIILVPEGIGSYLEDRPTTTTKVVTQTIAAGTTVAIGTAIDVVLAPTRDLPVKAISKSHAAFEALTVGELHDRFSGEPRLRDLLRTKSSASDLSNDDIASLTTVLNAKGVNVGTGPGETVGEAFNALQAAFTFQG